MKRHSDSAPVCSGVERLPPDLLFLLTECPRNRGNLNCLPESLVESAGLDRSKTGHQRARFGKNLALALKFRFLQVAIGPNSRRVNVYPSFL